MACTMAEPARDTDYATRSDLDGFLSRPRDRALFDLPEGQA